MPRVSIIMPIYNEAGNLARTLRSVLAQRFTDFELLVVDDGSTDSGVAELRDLSDGDTRVRVLSKANGGISRALNHGIEHASAELIARLDAGDVARESWLEGQLELLERSGAELVFGRVLLADAELRPFFVLPLRHSNDVTGALKRGKNFPHPFLLGTKSLFLRHGLYEIKDGIEDYVLWRKFANAGARLGASRDICGTMVREPAHHGVVERRLRARAAHNGTATVALERKLLHAGLERYIVYPSAFRDSISIPLRELALRHKLRFAKSACLLYAKNLYAKTLVALKS